MPFTDEIEEDKIEQKKINRTQAALINILIVILVALLICGLVDFAIELGKLWS